MEEFDMAFDGFLMAALTKELIDRWSFTKNFTAGAGRIDPCCEKQPADVEAGFIGKSFSPTYLFDG